jgi:hypothetical protein
LGIWNVRPTPRPIRRSGLSWDTSRPPIQISPDVGFRLPAIRLNSVVLPAPFGPISPTISPAASFKDMPATAVFPSNRFTRSRASITAWAGRAVCGAASGTGEGMDERSLLI